LEKRRKIYKELFLKDKNKIEKKKREKERAGFDFAETL